MGAEYDTWEAPVFQIAAIILLFYGAYMVLTTPSPMIGTMGQIAQSTYSNNLTITFNATATTIIPATNAVPMLGMKMQSAMGGFMALSGIVCFLISEIVQKKERIRDLKEKLVRREVGEPCDENENAEERVQEKGVVDTMKDWKDKGTNQFIKDTIKDANSAARRNCSSCPYFAPHFIGFWGTIGHCGALHGISDRQEWTKRPLKKIATGVMCHFAWNYNTDYCEFRGRGEKVSIPYDYKATKSIEKDEEES